MPAGEQIAFEPAFAKVFAEHFHHAAVGSEVVVDGNDRLHRATVGGIEDCVEAIRIRFIRAEQAEIGRVEFDDVAQILSEFARRFCYYLAGAGYSQCVLGEVGEIERLQ